MGLTQVNSEGIKDGEIKDADLDSSAAIAGSKLAAATTSAAGSMSAADKTKLDGVATSATANPSAPALTGSTNNTITTVTGANAIQGEANLTYNGTNLQAKQTGDTGQELIFDSNRSAADNVLGGITGYWDTDRVADISFRSGADTTNKDDGYITFRTSPSQGSIAERLRILSGGEVAIGGSGYAGQPFSVQTSTVNLGYMQSTGTTRAVMNFVDANSTVGVGFGCIGNNHVFLKDSAEKLRIQSGGGLSFNGDTAAANALDDYEEGDWTPAWANGITSGATYTVQNGKYIKIGRQVFATFYIRWNDATTTNAIIQIGGLPYTAANLSNTSLGHGTVTYHSMNTNGSIGIAACYMDSNATYFSIYNGDQHFSGPNTTSQNNEYLIGGLTYLAA